MARISVADEEFFSEGQNAFERGDTRETCPYVVEALGSRQMWLDGWDEARRYDEHQNQPPPSIQSSPVIV